MKISDMNWFQVEQYLKFDDRAVVPLGCTEQHAYLSLSVDSILAERVAVEAAAPLGVPVFPVVGYGITPSFMAYPGTVSLKAETYLHILTDILDSLQRTGFRRILFVNGHGGNSPGQTVKAGSMGRPLPGYNVVLLDSDGHVSETEGEICLRLDDRPLGLTGGYADDDARTSVAMRDGYYHTGDIASRDSDGYLTFVGRADDVFKASDYRLSPFELESVLIEFPAVAEAAVVPSPDPLRHAVPKAFVTLAAGFNPSRELAAEILAHCRNALAPYKRIRRIEFASLPKTISGKIRRIELRQAEATRRAAGERGEHEFFEEDL